MIQRSGQFRKANSCVRLPIEPFCRVTCCVHGSHSEVSVANADVLQSAAFTHYPDCSGTNQVPEKWRIQAGWEVYLSLFDGHEVSRYRPIQTTKAGQAFVGNLVGARAMWRPGRRRIEGGGSDGVMEGLKVRSDC